MKLLISIVSAFGMTLASPAHAGLATQTWCPNTTLLGFAWSLGCFSNDGTAPGTATATSPLLASSINSMTTGGDGLSDASVSPVLATNAAGAQGPVPVDAPATLPLFATGLALLALRNGKATVSNSHHLCRVFIHEQL